MARIPSFVEINSEKRSKNGTLLKKVPFLLLFSTTYFYKRRYSCQGQGLGNRGMEMGMRMGMLPKLF